MGWPVHSPVRWSISKSTLRAVSSGSTIRTVSAVWTLTSWRSEVVTRKMFPNSMSSTGTSERLVSSGRNQNEAPAPRLTSFPRLPWKSALVAELVAWEKNG